MRPHLLHTNILSYILKNVPPVPERLDAALHTERSFLLASIAHYELTRYLRLRKAHRLLRLYAQLTADWQRCEPSCADWDEAARLWAEGHGQGRAIADADLLLAVLAHRHGATLVTANVRHFADRSVDLEDWSH